MTATLIDLPAPSAPPSDRYGCPPWCQETDHDSSDGMPGWTGYTGTYMHWADRGVPLASLPFEADGQERHRTILAAAGQRTGNRLTGDEAPHIALTVPIPDDAPDFTADVELRMTLDEAEQYARALLELVAIARG